MHSKNKINANDTIYTNVHQTLGQMTEPVG